MRLYSDYDFYPALESAKNAKEFYDKAKDFYKDAEEYGYDCFEEIEYCNEKEYEKNYWFFNPCCGVNFSKSCLLKNWWIDLKNKKILFICF